MINRVLIRIRVLQIFFAWSLRSTKDIRQAETELLFSLQKSYDLYHYYLQLILELTDEYDKLVEQKKSKLLPSEQDKNPNTRLLENKFMLQLRSNLQLQEYLTERPFLWDNFSGFLNSTLKQILESEVYQAYIASDDRSYEADREFWRKIFKDFICANEILDSHLGDDSIYWNSDIEIVESFALKTIKQFDESKGENHKLLEMWKDEEDRKFAVKLLRESLFNGKDNYERIEKYASNWETDRITQMDMVIMQIALSEVLYFPNIPISVTLNEYINLAKSYSTPKSSSFINGVLDSIIKELKEKKEIHKI